MGRIAGMQGLGLFKKPCDSCNISFRLAIQNAGPGKLLEAYRRAPEELRDETSLALASLGKDGRCAEHVSARLKADKAFWSRAVNGSSVYALVSLFQHAPDAIRGDHDLALAAIARAAGCAEFVAGQLVADKAFWGRTIDSLSPPADVPRSAERPPIAAQCGSPFRFAPTDVRGDREIALAAVAKCTCYKRCQAEHCAEHVSGALAADRAFWSCAIDRSDRNAVCSIFRFSPDAAREDLDFALAAVARHWGCVRHISDRVRANKAFWKRTIENSDSGDAYIIFHDSPDEVRDDDDIALAAIGKSGSCAEHLSSRLTSDKAFWMRAIELSEWVAVCDLLRDAPEGVRDDPEIVLAGVAKIGYCAKFVSPKLRADKAFWLRAIPLMGDDWKAESLTHAEDGLRKDPDLYALCHPNAISEENANTSQQACAAADPG